MREPAETIITIPERPPGSESRPSILVHIYPTVSGMGTRYPLADKPMVIGRDNDCEISISDPSVSRHHVRIQPVVGGHCVVDLQSTNGTYINDQPATMSKLKDGDYLRVGNWIFRYLTGGNVESQYHEEIYRLTIIDALTGSHNKRSLDEYLDRELARCARYHRPLSLVLFDIDFFKNINDTYGHLAGDYTLREIANCVKATVRKEELFARYGGEEFALVLPEANSDGALHVAHRLRELIEKLELQFEGKSFRVTISLGAATTEGDEALTPDELIRRADEKLYAAKSQGRNRVGS